ncbi:hypothetical protein OPT61_g283 [Boeremia exigua]|uniref:Uncharacterized protein n=1 Tax=Boeremia exigua TaxID=749465 RepID=A0ACC2IUR4_9PLEO|nr:hypothetical protein OPT61_g283 [Boeremia exigua]
MQCRPPASTTLRFRGSCMAAAPAVAALPTRTRNWFACHQAPYEPLASNKEIAAHVQVKYHRRGPRFDPTIVMRWWLDFAV